MPRSYQEGAFIKLFLSAYENGSWVDALHQQPDKVERTKPAVDWLAKRKSDGKTLGSFLLRVFSITASRLSSTCCLRTCRLPASAARPVCNGTTSKLSVISNGGLPGTALTAQRCSEIPSGRRSRFTLSHAWTDCTINSCATLG